MFIKNGKTEEKNWLRPSCRPLFTVHCFPEDKELTSCPGQFLQ